MEIGTITLEGVVPGPMLPAPHAGQDAGPSGPAACAHVRDGAFRQGPGFLETIEMRRIGLAECIGAKSVDADDQHLTGRNGCPRKRTLPGSGHRAHGVRRDGSGQSQGERSQDCNRRQRYLPGNRRPADRWEYPPSRWRFDCGRMPVRIRYGPGICALSAGQPLGGRGNPRNRRKSKIGAK